MKKTALFLIKLYQSFFAYVLKSIVGNSNTCRFSPTCGEYARISIEKNGVFRGGQMALVRLLKCQPFYKGN